MVWDESWKSGKIRRRIGKFNNGEGSWFGYDVEPIRDRSGIGTVA